MAFATTLFFFFDFMGEAVHYAHQSASMREAGRTLPAMNDKLLNLRKSWTPSNNHVWLI